MDPHPIKHPGVLMAWIRDQVQPILSAQGFSFESRNNPAHDNWEIQSYFWPRVLWIDYRRGDETLSLRYDRRNTPMLRAERLNRQGNVEVVATQEIKSPKTYEEFMSCCSSFVRQLEAYLQCNDTVAKPTNG